MVHRSERHTWDFSGLSIFEGEDDTNVMQQAEAEGNQKKKYLTSCEPHHDIYTFSYCQIFWHSI